MRILDSLAVLWVTLYIVPPAPIVRHLLHPAFHTIPHSPPTKVTKTLD